MHSGERPLEMEAERSGRQGAPEITGRPSKLGGMSGVDPPSCPQKEATVGISSSETSASRNITSNLF